MSTTANTITCELKSSGLCGQSPRAPAMAGLVALCLAWATPAAAQDAVPPPPAESGTVLAPPAGGPILASPPPMASPGNPARMVGGHIGVAVPVVSFHHQGQTTETPSDQLTVAVPIGITVHVSPDYVVDFETIIGNPVKPAGFTGVTIDPGVVYVGGPVALGLRVKFDIGGPVNVGLIPLVHKGIVDFGDANWFIEAAFPITYSRLGAAMSPTGAGINDYTLAIVVHTGVAF